MWSPKGGPGYIVTTLSKTVFKSHTHEHESTEIDTRKQAIVNNETKDNRE